jgi:membrane protein DedA with SNARE-associated domain
VAVIDGLAALLPGANPDVSWLAQLLLFFLPFAHEDLAIVAGAFLVVNEIVSIAPVTLCIYAGILASDLALYAVGAGARQLPWVRRIAVDTRMRDFTGLIERNLFGLVALGRAVPGMAFIAFIACGWMRVPLARFMVASLSVSALYLPLMLCLWVFFGGALDDQAGMWTWPILLAIVGAMELVRRRVFGFQEAADAATAAQPATDRARSRSLRTLAPQPLPVRPVVRRPHWRSPTARPADVVASTAPTAN